MFQSFSRFLDWITQNRPVRPRRARPRKLPQLEVLEDRSVPATISGTVYYDANHDGLLDNGETGLGSIIVNLLKSDGTPIAQTTTDGNGNYQFSQDPTIGASPKTEEFDTSFPVNSQPNELLTTASPAIAQFDPSLGTLQSVQITYTASMTTEPQFESFDPKPENFSLTISGPLSLNFGNPGDFNPLTANLSRTVGSPTFAPSNLVDFGPQTTTNPNPVSVTLDASNTSLADFIGTGTVPVTMNSVIGSQEIGVANWKESGTTTVTGSAQVIYTYIPSQALRPGSYIVQEVPPTNYLNGLDSHNTPTGEQIIPGSDTGNRQIPVTITDPNGSSTNNNFGHLLPSSLAGTVFYDLNNTGHYVSGEQGLSGVAIQLSGTDYQGRAVNVQTTTDGNGNYSFNNLLPSNSSGYTLTELSQPAGYLDGKQGLGNAGGQVSLSPPAGEDVFGQINLGSGVNGIHYDFGKVLPGTLSGFVYQDVTDSGHMIAGEPGFGGLQVTLTGRDVHFQPVSLTTTTAGDGSYSFTNLLPGTYSVSETAIPQGYVDGKTSIDSTAGNGNLGGTVQQDLISNIVLNPSQAGTQYDFGKLKWSTLSGHVYLDSNNDGRFDGNDRYLAKVTVTLTGINDLGQKVTMTVKTATDGSYSFPVGLLGLRPGSYTITDHPPAGFMDGKDSLGTLTGPFGLLSPGRHALNKFLVQFSQPADGINYDFALRVKPATPTGGPPPDSPPPGGPPLVWGKGVALG